MIGQYFGLFNNEEYTDFSFLTSDMVFPSNNLNLRDGMYKHLNRLYTGEYNKNRFLIVNINGMEKKLPYGKIPLNYFKLMTNKITDLIFNTDLTIKSGDIERDKQIKKLVERKGVVKAFKKAFKNCIIYGSCGLKAYKYGISVFSPLYGFKVVDESDIENSKAIVLYELIYEKEYKNKKLKYIRFEIHKAGSIFEIAYEYYGGKLGRSVRLKYNNREIPAGGIWYSSGVDDVSLVQWCDIDLQTDSVYGISPFFDIRDIVFALEQRLSANQYLTDKSMLNIAIVGAGAVMDDPEDIAAGKEYPRKVLKLVNDNLLLSTDPEDVKSAAIELNYNLDNSEHQLSTLQSYVYEFSEMSRTFMSGEYSGNVSEETINNLIKSALDKANRYILDIYDSFRDALYGLCVLNGIKISRDELTIDFNIGRTDDDGTIADVATKLISNHILSRQTVREKFYGYNHEQSDAEDRQIEMENGSTYLQDVEVGEIGYEIVDQNKKPNTYE